MLSKYKAEPLHGADYPPKNKRGGRVGIYLVEDGKKVLLGEYERNYGSLFQTFFPFHYNGKDLALYSSDYTSTRIMELPLCKDLGGEERDEMGFCPVDYFVPTYIDLETVTHTYYPDGRADETVDVTRVNEPAEHLLAERTSAHEWVNGVTKESMRSESRSRPVTPVLYYPFGFVAGCIWGDDSSWKIQYLDLSEADRGILKREERFGFIELPEDLTLRAAIDMSDYGYKYKNGDIITEIEIQTVQKFDLDTGKPIHPWD